jgi:hypothetical protein
MPSLIADPSLRIAVCKSCLEPNFAIGICNVCGIKNWIGKDFLNNPTAIRKLEYKWGIPHGKFLALHKFKVQQFMILQIAGYIKRIRRANV